MGAPTLFCTRMRYFSFQLLLGLAGRMSYRLAPQRKPISCPSVARVLRLQHAQHGQRDRALGNRGDLAHGLAGAPGAARVAIEVTLGNARRQVGAAQLDVVARLGGEPLARKLELAKLAIGADHVLDVGDAAALRARRVGRAVGDDPLVDDVAKSVKEGRRDPGRLVTVVVVPSRLIAVGEAKGADREQFLAQLLLGRHRVHVAFPVAAVVALARRARVVAQALDAADRHPRVGAPRSRLRPHTVPSARSLTKQSSSLSTSSTSCASRSRMNPSYRVMSIWPETVEGGAGGCIGACGSSSGTGGGGGGGDGWGESSVAKPRSRRWSPWLAS